MGPPASSATIGIQNIDQSDGLTVAFNHVYVHDNLAVRITAAPRWLSASPAFGTLPPGQSVPVTVHFNAAGLAGGSYDGAVRISSDDPDEPVVAVAAHLAVGAAPDISLEGGTLSFCKSSMVGSADTQSLFVTNRGSAPLEISAVIASPGGIRNRSGPFTLAPSQEMEVAVTFRPTAAGTVIGALTFRSNDPDEPVATVVLSGNAIQTGPTIVGVAAFELEPRLLDARRREGWVIAKVELLPGYDPARVVLSTVKLLGRVPTVDRALRIGDFNRNGVPDLKFRFRRDQVLRALPEGDRVDVTITGMIRDSTFFQGKETVRGLSPSGPPSRPRRRDRGGAGDRDAAMGVGPVRRRFGNRDRSRAAPVRALSERPESGPRRNGLSLRHAFRRKRHDPNLQRGRAAGAPVGSRLASRGAAPPALGRAGSVRAAARRRESTSAGSRCRARSASRPAGGCCCFGDRSWRRATVLRRGPVNAA